ncbi:MAG: AmmeMemoRadiSam system protein B [Gammaproteobacteria bacterium]|nr:AmmeMemoRadiSam system protein B [Gammaproteobacteria bacterium]
MIERRAAAVAGLFYAGESQTLAGELQKLFAESPPADDRSIPKALIVPHAGFIYSGATAAAAYQRLRGARGQVTRAVLLGPAHRVYVRGLAVSSASEFVTPLGAVAVDRAGARALLALPQVTADDDAHASEHALEVQLPFLQTVLDTFEILPLVVGDASADDVADVLERVWGGTETLIVVSSDLSHYLPYAEAQAVDQATAAKILHGQSSITHEQACGATPINGLLLAARRHHLVPELLDLRNSGDTAGARTRVVGYAAFAFNAPHDSRGQILLGVARTAIANDFDAIEKLAPDAPWLAEPGASFVTLTVEGRLRGCVGSLEARRSIRHDVEENARAAAFRDPRFAPLTREEFLRIKIEVSELSPPVSLTFTSEADAARQLRPTIDGVIFECAGRRATFLPQVWAQLTTSQAFMKHLKQKAGFAAQFWSAEVKLARYGVTKWRES